MGGLVAVDRDADLAEAIFTLHPPGPFSQGLNRWHCY